MTRMLYAILTQDQTDYCINNIRCILSAACFSLFSNKSHRKEVSVGKPCLSLGASPWFEIDGIEAGAEGLGRDDFLYRRLFRIHIGNIHITLITSESSASPFNLVHHLFEPLLPLRLEEIAVPVRSWCGVRPLSVVNWNRGSKHNESTV